MGKTIGDGERGVKFHAFYKKGSLILVPRRGSKCKHYKANVDFDASPCSTSKDQLQIPRAIGLQALDVTVLRLPSLSNKWL